MRTKTRNSIYRELIRRGVSQSWLADKVGVQREYMNRIINEKIQPTIGLALKIAGALGKPVGELWEVKK